MRTRWLLGIPIIGVTVVMTTSLVRLTYFPEESRLAREVPDLVLERFLSRTATESLLDIWKGKQVVGSLRVTPQSLSSRDKEAFQAAGRIQAEAHVQVAFPGMEGTRLRLVSSMVMALDGSVKESDLRLDSNNLAQSLTISHRLHEAEPRFVLRQAEETILDTGAPAGALAADNLMGLFMRSIGVDHQDLKKRQRQAAQTAATASTEARRGGFTVLGHEFTGYVLTTTIGGADRKFTLYISESGELVQMKTSFLDYQFISEDLRPEGVHGIIPRGLKHRLSPALPP
jgi:hypothetical protein